MSLVKQTPAVPIKCEISILQPGSMQTVIDRPLSQVSEAAEGAMVMPSFDDATAYSPTGHLQCQLLSTLEAAERCVT